MSINFKILFVIFIGRTLCNSQLNFLVENPKQTINTLNFNSTLFFIDFIDGYLNGTGVYDAILTNSSCLRNFENLENGIMKIIDVAKQINSYNIFENLRQIIMLAENVVNYQNATGEACKEIYIKTLDLTIKIKEKLIQQDYLQNFLSHSISNLSTLREFAESAGKSFGKKEYYYSGIFIGKLVRFGFFWDM